MKILYVTLSVLATSVDGNRAATPEADYQGGTYTAIFEANSGGTSISIPIFDDDFQEQSPETFVVKIDGIVGTDSAAKVISNPDERRTTVCIQDDDDLFNLEEDDIYVSESTGTYTTSVKRVGSANTLETVSVYTTDGTATSPSDYTPIQTSLSFPPGTTSQPVTFQIVNDKVEEPSKNFVLILASKDGSIIGRAVTTVTIQDDDFPISFKDNDAVVYVDEDDVTLTVTVQRTRADNAVPGETARVTVMSREVSSTSNPASESSDFDAVSTEVEFSRSGTQVDVTINIRDDNIPEEEEKFELYLADPSPSSSHYIAYPHVITVCIRDDDGMPPGDVGGGTPDDTDDGGGISRSAIVLIGGGVGVLLLIGVLGMIGCFAVSRMRPGVPPAAQRVQGPRSAPPAYSNEERPIELSRVRRQQPPNYYSNGGYRY
ncbi:sodium/calcium exchanger 1-like [Amphiura filiformis]|uniref:sodium/calcium exchanger 1-like n=1 Tax=Amphiura filiformis TaxID=82378 RepID=UPI003B20C330